MISLLLQVALPLAGALCAAGVTGWWVRGYTHRCTARLVIHRKPARVYIGKKLLRWPRRPRRAR